MMTIVYFLGKKITLLNYNLHYRAYNVQYSNSDCILIKINELETHFPTKIHVLSNGELYIPEPIL